MTVIANNVVVITGAASGLGKQLALLSASRGARHVVGLDIDEAGLDALSYDLKCFDCSHSTYVSDIASRESVEATAEIVNREHGGADILINNAGVSLVCPTAEASYENLEWVMNINFWGVVYGTKSFLPQMVAKGSGHIANVSSVMGVFTTSMSSAYSSSKFAVRGFTESLRQELRNTGIKVSCVHPGGVKTNVMLNSRYGNEDDPEQRKKASDHFLQGGGLTAENAASKLLAGIEKNKKRVMIGSDARVIDLITRLIPGHYDRLLGSWAEEEMQKMREL